MSNLLTLIKRNTHFASGFTAGQMPAMPKLRMIVLACVDARVNPKHVLELELGDAFVMRNVGARVTPAVIDEISALAFLVSKLDADTPGSLELAIIQHTHCGAERFADPEIQRELEANGVDLSQSAITDHQQCLHADIERLRIAPQVPDQLIVSGLIYDIETGHVKVVIDPAPLKA